MPFTYTITFHPARGSIYSVLAAKLGRAPTDSELRADVQRIRDSVLVDMAAAGKLQHQRKPSRRRR